jgi:hypothetical protein
MTAGVVHRAGASPRTASGSAEGVSLSATTGLPSGPSCWRHWNAWAWGASRFLSLLFRSTLWALDLADGAENPR